MKFQNTGAKRSYNMAGVERNVRVVGRGWTVRLVFECSS